MFNALPPEAAANQLIDPELLVALKVKIPASQRAAGAVAMMAGIKFTLTMT